MNKGREKILAFELVSKFEIELLKVDRQFFTYDYLDFPIYLYNSKYYSIINKINGKEQKINQNKKGCDAILSVFLFDLKQDLISGSECEYELIDIFNREFSSTYTRSFPIGGMMALLSMIQNLGWPNKYLYNEIDLEKALINIRKKEKDLDKKLEILKSPYNIDLLDSGYDIYDILNHAPNNDKYIKIPTLVDLMEGFNENNTGTLSSLNYLINNENLTLHRGEVLNFRGNEYIWNGTCDIINGKLHQHRDDRGNTNAILNALRRPRIERIGRYRVHDRMRDDDDIIDVDDEVPGNAQPGLLPFTDMRVDNDALRYTATNNHPMGGPPGFFATDGGNINAIHTPWTRENILDEYANPTTLATDEEIIDMLDY